jgi:hypothetical protein
LIYSGEVARWDQQREHYFAVQLQRCIAERVLSHNASYCTVAAQSGTGWMGEFGRELGAFEAGAWVVVAWALWFFARFVWRWFQKRKALSVVARSAVSEPI